VQICFDEQGLNKMIDLNSGAKVVVFVVDSDCFEKKKEVKNENKNQNDIDHIMVGGL